MQQSSSSSEANSRLANQEIFHRMFITMFTGAR